MESNFQNDAETAVQNAKIVKQLEFYFGDTHLPHDTFLQRQIKLDDGWVSIGELLSAFKTIISRDAAVIASAAGNAVGSIVEVDGTNTKIRRKSDIDPAVADHDLFRELIGMSVHCAGFPSTVTADRISEFAATFGENVIIKVTPVTLMNQTTLNGSAYFTFSYKFQAQEFLERDTVEYDGVRIERMWQKQFLLNQLPEGPVFLVNIT